MSLLRHIAEDEVCVPQVNRLARYLMGAFAILTCTLLLLLQASHVISFHMPVLAMTSLSVAIGVACFSWVSFVRINRKTGTITRRWGFFLPGTQADETVTPTAVRLLIDSDREDSSVVDQHAIVLVHSKGETLLRRSWSLETARRLSEEVAQFLGVERYEDRLPERPVWRTPLTATVSLPGLFHTARQRRAMPRNPFRDPPRYGRDTSSAISPHREFDETQAHPKPERVHLESTDSTD